MKKHCAQLKELFREVPSYGSGTVQDMTKVFQRYQFILSSISSPKEPGHSIHVLKTNATDIAMFIHDAGKAKGEKLKQEYFERAANELSLDLQSLMEIIKCR